MYICIYTCMYIFLYDMNSQIKKKIHVLYNSFHMICNVNYSIIQFTNIKYTMCISTAISITVELPNRKINSTTCMNANSETFTNISIHINITTNCTSNSVLIEF